MVFIQGLAQSVSSASRTVGPIADGWLYGLGLRKGVVGGLWWGLAGLAIVGQVASGCPTKGMAMRFFWKGRKKKKWKGVECKDHEEVWGPKEEQTRSMPS